MKTGDNIIATPPGYLEEYGTVIYGPDSKGIIGVRTTHEQAKDKNGEIFIKYIVGYRYLPAQHCKLLE